MPSDPFVMFALACAALSAVLLVWFAFRPRPVTRAIKVVLLFGIGLLPIATAMTGNIAGYHATKQTQFCSSCHTMAPYGADSWNPVSTSLAARHARNDLFGDENCYACHADYGMFGTVTTKLGGMRHVYEYLFHWGDLDITTSLERIEIRRPFQNATCMHCHSTRNPLFDAVGDHASARDQIRGGSVSCASAGCHGPAHPFSKAAKARAREREGR